MAEAAARGRTRGLPTMMRHLRSRIAAALIVALPVVSSRAVGQTPEELAQTRAYAAALQNPDGGFGAGPGQASTLGGTTAGVRVLKYTGGSVPQVAKCLEYIRSCFDPATGGFGATPGAKPEVGTTASGLMAVGEMKIVDEAMVEKAVKFLSEKASTFPDVRIAVAGLEAVAKEVPEFPKWVESIQATRKPDGTWGEGDTRAFDTGGSAAALLRMGHDLEHRDAVVAAIREGQRKDGGWGSKAGDSELGATYRVMRCFYMMGQKPDLEGVRRFVGSCRKGDGSYGDTPSAGGTIGSTYSAMIVLRWCRLLEGLPAAVERAGFKPLFDGKSLDGWQGETSLWSARGGMLVGTSAGLDHNEFLVREGKYRDFVLQLSFRLVDGKGNSGIQFRSDRLPGTEMIGYQADIGEDYWGGLYDESRRKKVLAAASEQALGAVNKEGWNHYVVRSIGDQITLSMNGRTSVSYEEKEEGIAEDGSIAVQLHAGAPMEVQFRDILIQPLPRPTESPDATPGFHVRSLKYSPERKYVVYVPQGFSAAKPYPVVLFLHGSGERGEDGIVPSQVGLGPIVAGRPADYPFLVVFPQAREGWAPDGEDAKAALQALDETIMEFTADANRVILTGLSMGGAGTWEMAAKDPKRFAAIVPVCGPPKGATPAAVAELPIWMFCGDEDRPGIVQGMREMAAGLRQMSVEPKVTEYRGVGHNSWDRAYSDPELVAWMLQQARPSK